MRALISVSDKTGIEDLAKQLNELGVEIISTGGTAKCIKDSGIDVIPVDQVTGFPECLDGRVKTLHPKIHAGILARRDNKKHMKQLDELSVETIDLVIINLYPFRETISKDNVQLEDAIENIDIGGPTMLRSAAKNFQDVAVVVDPVDYKKVITELKENGEVSIDTKFYLSYKVFQHTASYDALIANYMREIQNIDFPETLTLTYEKVQDLRYGENPHQDGAFYKEMSKMDGTLAAAEQLHGKELSYNNIADTNGALDVLREFKDEITYVGVKHSNPCGVGSAETGYEAWRKAYSADPVSIFGGIVVTNAKLDKKVAEDISKIFIEVVVAPEYDDDALEILKGKKNIRLLKLPSVNCKLPSGIKDMKKVAGGLLVQDMDRDILGQELDYVTDKTPTKEEMEDMIFAWKVVKHVKSNAIVLAKNKQTVGIGIGQVNRIWPTEQAIKQAGENAKGSVMASDAYFPFGDCAEAAAKAGIVSIIHPGGSRNDKLTEKVCKDNQISLVYTGMRHFKHS